MSSDELYHFGMLGMKWGIRRFQNEDGTYTELGKQRRRKEDYSSKRALQLKSPSEMTDDELRKVTNRMKLENDFKTTKKISTNDNFFSKIGRKFIDSYADKLAGAAVTAAILATSKIIGEKYFKNLSGGNNNGNFHS